MRTQSQSISQPSNINSLILRAPENQDQQEEKDEQEQEEEEQDYQDYCDFTVFVQKKHDPMAMVYDCSTVNGEVSKHFIDQD